MLSVEEALEHVLGAFHVLESEEKPLLETQEQVLAEDVVSLMDIPPTDNSAMDGYAVQADSIVGASRSSPVVLRVLGVISPGQMPQAGVGPGTAVRIMTGATLPEGADAVVPFEETDEADRRTTGETPQEIGIYAAVRSGSSVRPSGQDARRGVRIIERGTLVRSPHIGIIASLGHKTVSVVRRPLVGVLATGNELIEPEDTFMPGVAYNSNSYGIAAEVARSGGTPMLLGIARDNMESLSAKLREGLEYDFLITTGGVSKGDYDIVGDFLAQNGEVTFRSVRMRPGKPVVFGVLYGPDGKTVPHLGLPGNPASALVAFEQFGRPAVWKMLGKTRMDRPTISAVLEQPIHNADGRRVYARAKVTRREGTYHATLAGHQGSNLLTPLADANGLAICPEDVTVKGSGETVEVQMIDWPEVVF